MENKSLYQAKPNYIKGFRQFVRSQKRAVKDYLQHPIYYHNEKYVRDLLCYTELKDKEVMIVGLGQGLEVPVFLSNGAARVTAIEPFPRENLGTFGSQFQLIEAFAESMPVESNSIDVIYTVATLEHIQDPKKAVREMLRVLQPGGILYCSTNPLWYSPFGYHAKSRYPKLYDPWFHIIYTEEDYLSKRSDLRDDPLHRKRINQIYNSPGYNRLPFDVYLDIQIDVLKHHYILKMEYDGIQKNLSMLSRNKHLRNQLNQYELPSLVTEGMTMVIKKRPV